VTGWLGRLTLARGPLQRLKLLRVLTLVLPPLFVVGIDLLRHLVIDGTVPSIWGTLWLFGLVLVAASLFSRFVTFAGGSLLRARIRELETVADVGETVDNAFDDMNTLMRRAIDKLIEFTKADSAELYLFDLRRHSLVYALGSGSPKDAPEGNATQFELRERLMEEGIRSRHSVTIMTFDTAQNEPVAPSSVSATCSVAIVPLKLRNSTLGVVCLLSPNANHFNRDDASLLLRMGNRIAVAIDRARRYEKAYAVAMIEERERISMELHDGMGQILGHVITQSQATRQLLRNMTVATDYLAEIENVAQEVYTDTREMILGLKSGPSGDKSMVTALREYVTRYEQVHGIRVELKVGERLIPSLSLQIELQALRVVQEALSNIRKHAEATRAYVSVTAADDSVTIVVEDDGKGFDVDEVAKRHGTQFGLRSMKDRADSINASLAIESQPQHGTKVTMCLPLYLLPATAEMREQIESTDS